MLACGGYRWVAHRGSGAAGDECTTGENCWNKTVNELWCSGARFRATYRRDSTVGSSGTAATALTRHRAGMKHWGIILAVADETGRECAGSMLRWEKMGGKEVGGLAGVSAVTHGPGLTP